jgi:hypothetical protein
MVGSSDNDDDFEDGSCYIFFLLSGDAIKETRFVSYQSILFFSRYPPKVLWRQWVAIYKRTCDTGQFGDEVVAFG